ncbi:unnamed protein product [Orchesella dallaii]|uniref:Uncharacterized protein n=1 Tax=Orchesella dallaii TaxID=48710 RepID=A0ABP1QKR6_9HEXA
MRKLHIQGRVVVRLERLMGSDRIRITDPKYLATLVERLEEEEAQGWVTRSRLRKKAEKNRSRQLAIEGLMEPASDMQDLWNHPVFRVNRVLNRLALFDQNMSHAAGTLHKVPPIHPVEIFADDETGSIFKAYPGHRVFARDDIMLDEFEHDQTELPPKMSSSSNKDKADRLRNLRKSLAHVKKDRKSQGGEEEEGEEEGESKEDEGAKEDEEEGEEEENAEEGDEEDETDSKIVVAGTPAAAAAAATSGGAAGSSLQEMQRIYGVEPDENLVRDWEAYRSHLVDMVYQENGDDGDDLYYMGYEVNGVYTRQQDTADDFMTARNRQIAEEERAVIADDTPTNDSSGPQDEVEEGDDGEVATGGADGGDDE